MHNFYCIYFVNELHTYVRNRVVSSIMPIEDGAAHVQVLNEKCVVSYPPPMLV